MENNKEMASFPEQNEPSKLHGTHDDSGQKERYIRDSGKIEDIPELDTPKMKAENKEEEDAIPLTDRSGEEKKEEYINTDERQNDLNRRNI